MAKSQILKDLVTNKTDLESILSRLKVIFMDIGDKTLLSWIDGELMGFNGDDIPKYRIIKGIAKGTFVLNGQAQYTNANVPIEALISDSEFIDEILTVQVGNTIQSIQNLLESPDKENMSRVIPTYFCHKISRPDFQLLGMAINISSTQLNSLTACVKSKLIEIIMELEKQFDNLDDLDITDQIEQNEQKKEQVVYNIMNIIDNSTEIGDKNNIKKSGIGHFWGKDKNI